LRKARMSRRGWRIVPHGTRHGRHPAGSVRRAPHGEVHRRAARILSRADSMGAFSASSRIITRRRTSPCFAPERFYGRWERKVRNSPTRTRHSAASAGPNLLSRNAERTTAQFAPLSKIPSGRCVHRGLGCPQRHNGTISISDRIVRNNAAPSVRLRKALLGHLPVSRRCERRGPRSNSLTANAQRARHPVGARDEKRLIGVTWASLSASPLQPRRGEPSRFRSPPGRRTAPGTAVRRCPA